ncbi:MAG: B12-binding domain-containing radical SAM protein [Synergistaceae bacterium]|nr:B12-binding domain-containing radical SAM protein [Synergistaceae bacterium]
MLDMQKFIDSTVNKKILAIAPPVYDFAYADLWSKPLGLLYIMEGLKAKNLVSFIDCIAFGATGDKTFGRKKIKKMEMAKPSPYEKLQIKRRFNRFGLDEKEFLTLLNQIEEPDYILLTSTMTYQYIGVQETIRILRSCFPSSQIILGGVYASLCYNHAKTLGADEISCHFVPSSPYPAVEFYNNPFGKEQRLSYGVLMTSFGCPFSCEYCASNILWKHYHRRDVVRVLKDFEYQYNLGARDFAFYDDALLLQKEDYIFKICRALKNTYGDTFRLHTPNGLHVRQITKETAEIFGECNFRTLRLSLESTNFEIERASSGKVACIDYINAVKNLESVGYTPSNIETYILLGLPNQSVKSVKDTINFVKDNGGKPKLAEFSPIPGTPYFTRACEKNPEIKTEPLLQNNSVYTAYVSKNMTPEMLQELKDMCRIIY